MIYELFPTTIILLENFFVSNQLIGLECLRLYLNHQHSKDSNLNCLTILKSNGYDQLLFIKLRHMLHKTDDKTFDILMENLHIILMSNFKTKRNVKFVLTSNNLKSALETDKNLEEVFVQLMDNLIIGQLNTSLACKHLKSLQSLMFPLLECNLIKFAKSFILAIDVLLDKSLLSFSGDLTKSCLMCLCHFMSAIKGHVSVDEARQLLNSLSKILVKLNVDQANGEESILECIYKLLLWLERSPNESVVKLLKQFCEVSARSEVLRQEMAKYPDQVALLLTRNGPCH